MSTKAELKKKSLDELKAIAEQQQKGSQRGPASVVDGEEPERPASIRNDLSQLSVEQLRELKGQVVPAGANHEKPDTSDQLEGVARSVLGSHPLSMSEPVISAISAAIGYQPKKGQTMAETIEQIKSRYQEERARGQQLIKKYPASDVFETGARSALETVSFGASEPAISGATAVLNTVGDVATGNVPVSEALPTIKKNYTADQRRREALQESMPAVDIGSQIAGAFLTPQGLVRSGAKAALKKFAPGVVEKGAAAITEFFTKNPTAFKAALKQIGAIGVAGANAAVDVAEQEAVRSVTLGRTGFIDEDEQANPIDAASTGAKIGAGIRALPAAYKGLRQVGKFTMATFMGVDPAQASRYLQNIQRLKNKKADLYEVAGEINTAVQNIQDDFASKKLTRDQAQAAVDAVEESIKESTWYQRNEIRAKLKDAQQQLNLAFKEDQAALKTFQRGLPERHFQDVQSAVEEARTQALSTKTVALGVLENAQDKIQLTGLEKVLTSFKKQLNVVGKDSALGDAARAAQAKADEYIARIKEIQKKAGTAGVPAAKLRKMVDQLDDDINYMDQQGLGAIVGSNTIGLKALRHELNQRLSVVPGWDEAIGLSREAAQRLERVRQYFDSPEKIVSSLKNIGDDANFLGREVLEDLGEATGRNFTAISADAQQAATLARSPREMDAIKRSLPEYQRMQKIEQELMEAQNPSATHRAVRSQVEQTPEYQRLQQAQAQMNAAENASQDFKNWSEMNIDNKIKSIMRGKQALRSQLETLGKMSDKDFVEAVDDLRTLMTFEKEFKIGSRNVNLWLAMGAGANSMANNPPSARIGFAAVLGAITDKYGPKMAKKILDGVGTIEGVVTAEKIQRMNLPPYVTQDLIGQFSKAVYYGVNTPEANVQVGPEEAAVLRREIKSQKGLSNIQKAKQLNSLNRYGTVQAGPVLLGNAPPPSQEERDIEEPISVMGDLPVAPGLPEIMSRLRAP